MKKALSAFLLLCLAGACRKETGSPTPAPTTPQAPQQPIARPYKIRYQITDSGGFHTDRHNGYKSWNKTVDIWDSLTVDTTAADPARRYLLIGVDTFRFRDSSLTILPGNKISGQGGAARNMITPNVQPPVIYVTNNLFRINYDTYMGMGGTIDGLIIKGIIHP